MPIFYTFCNQIFKLTCIISMLLKSNFASYTFGE